MELGVQQQFLLLPQSSLESIQPPEWVSCASCQIPTVTFGDCFLFAYVCNLISCNNIVLSSHITTGVTLTSGLKKNHLVDSCAWCLKDFQFGQVTLHYINLILLLEIKPLVFWKLDILLSFWFPQKYWGLLSSQVLEGNGGKFSVACAEARISVQTFVLWRKILWEVMSEMCQFRFELNIAFSS